MSAHDYSVFGLKVTSQIELPELFADESDVLPDVTITTGRVSGEWEAGLHPDHDALVLVVPEIARFRIAKGTSITVDAMPHTPERNVRLFLLGSAFGALLHQRGLLPLHANAIEIGGKAIAFMGESGAGKSTLAAWFHDRGYRVLADDVCVVRFDDDGRPMTCAGLPRLRLWLDAIERLGKGAGYERSYSDPNERPDKFDIPIEFRRTVQDSRPLAALYRLDRADHLEIHPLEGLKAAESVFANTYRGSFLPAVGGQHAHWQDSIGLVRACPVFCAAREWNLATFEEQCQALLDHAQNIVAGRPCE